MAPAPFDPARHWLGLDAVDLVDPRRVLGLAAGETDRPTIARAAEERLAKLAAVPPGPFDRARDALMQRVREARDSLLADAPPPVAPRLAMPPPPGGSPAASVPRPPAVPVVPRPAAPPPPAAFGEPSSEPVGFNPVVVRPTVASRRRSSGGGILLVLIAALAAAAGGLSWYKLGPGAAPRRPARPDVARVEPEDRDDVVPHDRVATPPIQKPAKRRPPKAAATPKPVPEPDPEPRPEAPAPPPPVARAPQPEPVPPAEESPEVAAKLAAASAAVRAGDFAAAEAAVNAAADAAMTPGGRTRVEWWSELVTFAKGFAGYREQALATVREGQEYEIEGKKIIVVEIDKRQFVYRFGGRNRTEPRDRIPGKIVMAIVEAWFDENPANDLYIGAYHATKSEPDLEKARMAWERAAARGADASRLLPLLDDPIIAAAEPR